jgi:hypothetical protein
LQPDKGNVCALWIAALIEAAHPASGTCTAFRIYAFDALGCAVYVHTVEVVPASLRR